MMKSTSVFLLALLVLAGCQGGKGKTVKNDVSEPTKPVETTTPPETVPEGFDPNNPEVKKYEEKVFAIKSSQSLGYSSTEEARELSLGEKVDQALSATDPTIAHIRFEMNNAGDHTLATPKIKIQDQENFAVEYVVPEYPRTISRLIRKEGRQVVFKGNKIQGSGIKPLPEKMSKADIEVWMREFPERMFADYSQGSDHWSTVISALKDPKNGFETEVTEKVTDVKYPDGSGKIVSDGKPRPFYRIVSKSKDGKNEVEIVIDSIKYMPVTVRTNQTKADGKQLQIWWAASWGYGGKFTEKDFQIPGA